MDTQKKFSALQSEYREKQASYEEELATQKSTFQNQLEAENSEKKSLAKELVKPLKLCLFSRKKLTNLKCL
jgi:hypothetical protein